ncbi:acid protease [Rhizodiscina lignyota]|uniref:Acid protease n=1 Tax=Rhizodiscina lignyota TaxID=1504668 RepID=A0A9P4IC68_9PEZI|nr:acid protease [Rhizodiscina lignyota]
MRSPIQFVVLWELLDFTAAAVQLDFKVERSSTARSRLKPRGYLESPIENAQDALLYLIPVTIGSPPQSVMLQVDTGSNELWFPYKESTECTRNNTECTEGTFDPSASDTYRTVAKGKFGIPYADTTNITGDYFTDSLGLGQQTIEGMVMGLSKVSQIPKGLQSVPFEGIIGVGPKARSETFNGTHLSIAQQMKKQGLIATESYSLWLNGVESSTGSILWGAVDKSKYEGELVALPIQPDPDFGEITQDTVVTLDNVGIINKNNATILAKGLKTAVVPDSGSTSLSLPKDLYLATAEAAGVLTDDSLAGGYLPCDSAQKFDDEGAALTFGFGNADGPVIKVPISQLLRPFAPGDLAGTNIKNDTPICQWNVGPVADGSSDYILGDSFMRSAYFVYDFDNKILAIAQTVFNATGEPDIEEITGSDIPGVTSTATGNYREPTPSKAITSPINVNGSLVGTGTFSTSVGPTMPLLPSFTGAASVIQPPSASFIGLMATGLTLASGVSGMLMVLL